MRHIAVVLLIATFAAVVQAAPPEFKYVPADVVLLMHLDVDGLWQTASAQKVYSELVKDAKLNENMRGLVQVQDVLQQLHFDPRKDLHGITYFAKKAREPGGAVIVVADINRGAQEQLLEKIKKYPEMRTVTHGTHQIFSWKKGDNSPSLAFYRRGAIIVADTINAIEAALDVLDGKSPSLHGGNSPITENILPGTIFLIRGCLLTNGDVPVKSALVQECQSLSFVLGKQQTESFLDANFVATSGKEARLLKIAAKGVHIWLRLLCKDDPQAIKALKKVEIAAVDKVVTVKLRTSPQEMGAIYRQIWKKINQYPDKPQSPQEKK